MKRYEAPVVELTKFDIEDVITASGDITPIDVSTLTGEENVAAREAAKGNIADGDNGSYNGGIFAW